MKSSTTLPPPTLRIGYLTNVLGGQSLLPVFVRMDEAIRRRPQPGWRPRDDVILCVVSLRTLATVFFFENVRTKKVITFSIRSNRTSSDSNRGLCRPSQRDLLEDLVGVSDLVSF